MDSAPIAAEPLKPVVLVIEDEPTVRRPIVMTFNRMGYEVLEATSAAEASAQWAAHQARISAVVSDNMLGPGPTGLSLLRQFTEARAALPTVLISGVLTIDVIRSIESASSIRCMQKPFEFRALVELVARRMRELAAG